MVAAPLGAWSPSPKVRAFVSFICFQFALNLKQIERFGCFQIPFNLAFRAVLDALCHQVSTSGGWKSTWSKARFPVVSESKASHYTIVETADDVVFVAVRVHAMIAVAKKITDRRLHTCVCVQ